jgi:hypothetical protein
MRGEKADRRARPKSMLLDGHVQRVVIRTKDEDFWFSVDAGAPPTHFIVVDQVKCREGNPGGCTLVVLAEEELFTSRKRKIRNKSMEEKTSSRGKAS